jgi:DNA invertase Pin-like site-specific DNA recombinase
MKTIAYSYTDPLLESAPDSTIWGWEVDRIYQDLGDRQQLQQLLQDCQSGSDDASETYLLVRRLEELGDSVQAVGDRLAEFETLGIHLIAIEEKVGADSQPLTRADLLKLLRSIQDSQRSRHIRKGHARNRIKALPPPGKVPYGYRRGKDRYVVDRSTAPIVKEFFDNFLLYGSLRGGVRHLEKKYGKKISVSTGKRWLTSPVYRGDLLYQNGEVVSDTHAAIVTREEAAQVDRLLRRNRRLSPRAASAPRSLAGLVFCAACNSPMTVTRVTAARKSQEYLYLRPIACPNRAKCRALSYKQILEQTIQRICQDLPQAVSGAEMPDLERIKQGVLAQVAAKQAVLEQLQPLVTSGVLDVETADLRAYKIRTEISALQAQLAQFPPVNLRAIAQAVSIPQFWLDLSEAERRFYFREFIRQIQICRQDQDWQIQLNFIF